MADTKLVGALKRLLADSYFAMLKAHKFHWNVEGPQFITLHALFGDIYTDLFGAVDVVAEGIRMLKVKAPGSFSEFEKLTEITESASTFTSSEGMIKGLLADQEKLAKCAEEVIEAAQAVNDEATADIGIKRAGVHKKHAWFLRSLLK